MNERESNHRTLSALSTDKLENLFSDVMHEMRRRDSKHMSGDVITKSQSLRLLRSTNKIPEKR